MGASVKAVIPFVDPTAEPAKTYRILLVDDDADILNAIGAYVERAIPNVKVLTAPGGPQALELLRHEDVDVILTDFRMPGMDGLQFLEEARKLAPNVPRLMLTAYADVSLATRAVNDEAVSKFLTKPIDPPVLVAALREVIDRVKVEEMRKHSLEGMLGRDR